APYAPGRPVRGRGGRAARPVRGHAPPPRGRLCHDDRLPNRHRHSVGLDGAAPDPALLRASRLGAVRGVRWLVEGNSRRPALLAASRPRARILPGGGAGATRSAVLDVLREDYVRTARAKGVAEARVIAA